MAIDIMQSLDIIEVMENFLEQKRPPAAIRHQYDMGYSINNQSIVLYEIRPQWRQPDVKQEHPFAKASFVKAKNHWKIYWQTAQLKWTVYSTCPTVDTLAQFTKLVMEDKHHAFFG